MTILNSKPNLESNGTLKKPVIIVISFFLITATVFLVVSELRQTVTIDISGEKQTITVWAWTVRDALKNAEIKVYTGDKITPAEDARLPDDGYIILERSFWVSITADGETKSIWTTERLPHNFQERIKDTMILHSVSMEELERRKKAFMDMWGEMKPIIEKEVKMSFEEMLQIV